MKGIKRIGLGLLLWTAALSAAHLTLNVDWSSFVNDCLPPSQRKLNVAYIPVTCHLACPVTDFISRYSLDGNLFIPRMFQGFPEIKEAMIVPFSTWLLMGFFKSIPRDLEDAAMVDGLSRFQTFAKLVVPISYSGILTVAIFSFTLVLQEFVYALTFVSSASQQTVSVGVPIFLVRGDVYYWGSLMAGCLLASVPVAVVYNLFLDRFITGFTAGAVK